MTNVKKAQKVIGIIPARFASSRFPGKVLAEIAGKPMIQRVYELSGNSATLDELLVAVDDKRVYDCVTGFGGRAVMTSTGHQSGTDRLAEVMSGIEGDIVVNIQGDQPLFDARMIDECVEPLVSNPEIPMSTLKVKIAPHEYHDPGVVKVVTDKEGLALYFSRSLIPHSRDNTAIEVYEHIGLYAYRKDFLFTYAGLPQTYLEKTEMLEQLRVLEHGYKIYVAGTVCHRNAGFSVDTPEDLKQAEQLLALTDSPA
jgi:3-deoxy-manno-octulosonate cytidylyltransferase (CMP-KDO synthetase)